MASVKRSPGEPGEVIMIMMMPATIARTTAKNGRPIEAPSLRSHIRRFDAGVGCCTVGTAISTPSYCREAQLPPKVVARRLFSNHNIRAYQKQAQTQHMKVHVATTWTFRKARKVIPSCSQLFSYGVVGLGMSSGGTSVPAVI